MKKWILAAVLLFFCIQPAVWAAPAVETERVRVPLEVEGKTFLLDAMLYKPAGEGPCPGMVITHGTPRLAADRAKTKADTYFVRQSQTFAQLGIAVLFVVRRGFGISDGPNKERYLHPGGSRNYTQDGLEAAMDIGAAVRYLQAQSFVDSNRMVLLGQSTGGHSVTAAGSLNLPGVVGVVNFAGGRGSSAPDVVRDEANLIASYAKYGKTIRVPSLWLYSQNDHYFGPDLARRFLKAFQAGGAEVEFISLPPYGADGHSSFVRAKDNWYAPVLEFLKRIGVVTETEAFAGWAA